MFVENIQSLIKSQEFGVEFEFTYITRDTARYVLDSVFGHDGQIDDEGRQWEVKSDGSIEPMRRDGSGRSVPADNNYKVEVESPILKYEDIPLVQEVIRGLRRAGAGVSKFCGCHIHVSNRGHCAQSLRNLLRLVYQKEELLKEAFQIPDDRLKRYCDRVNDQLIEELNNKKPTTIDKLHSMWDETGNSRYKMCNLESLFNGTGIEFRLFNMSFHAGVIKSYIIFCLAFSAKAMVIQRTVPRKSDQHNNRYEWRNFLNRIGLSGEEYKNVRRHLLKHVSGDSSFADPSKHDRNFLNMH